MDCVYYASGPGNISVVLLSMECQLYLRFNQKHLNLCFEDERRFGMTWGQVINDRMFLLGWTNASISWIIFIFVPYHTELKDPYEYVYRYTPGTYRTFLGMGKPTILNNVGYGQLLFAQIHLGPCISSHQNEITRRHQTLLHFFAIKGKSQPWGFCNNDIWKMKALGKFVKAFCWWGYYVPVSRGSLWWKYVSLSLCLLLPKQNKPEKNKLETLLRLSSPLNCWCISLLEEVVWWRNKSIKLCSAKLGILPWNYNFALRSPLTGELLDLKMDIV